MKARPNPWIALPAILLGALIGYIGWVITDASCRLDGPTALNAGCPVASTIVALASFVGAAFGVALVLSLVYRSLAEYRERDQNQ
ncbi:MAG TPA: hypothetical protein VM470_08400 [Acidimicrobiia bacterium]|nr:hypothetical protein [Acidimicrobiia bacterium]